MHHHDELVLHMRGEFSPRLTFDCGQAFRWRETAPGVFSGVVFGRALTLYEAGNGFLLRGDGVYDDAEQFSAYFDAQRDYDALVAHFNVNPFLAKAGAYARGIRLLKQDPWETLITFIISQNNNIARIRGIIERLCEAAGEEIAEGVFSFPTPKEILSLPSVALSALKLGYRDRYILDAAQRVQDGRINLQTVAHLTTYEAKMVLKSICGVGEKVADCVMLFGFGMTELSPNDVWIKRVMAAWLPNGYPPELIGAEGIAQQYLFHYARNHPEELSCALTS